ncbi:MAG: copper amine oxidase N-terminal domain-containing protein [Solirubrobacterales bacterium]
MRKQSFVVVAMVLLWAFMASTAYGAISQKVNGAGAPGAAPVMQGGLVYVDAGALAAATSGKMTIAGKTVTLQGGGRVLVMTVGSPKAKLDGRTVSLAGPAKMMKGRPMVPGQSTAALFGCSFTYNKAQQTVAIDFQVPRLYTAAQLMAEANDVMRQYNTTKSSFTLTCPMSVTVTPPVMSIAPDAFFMNMEATMLIKEDPNYCYTKTTGTTRLLGETTVEITEEVETADSIYTRNPAQGDTWYQAKKTEAEQAASESDSNAAALVLGLGSMGTVYSYDRDQMKNGQMYWVINMGLPQEAKKQFYDGILGDTSSPDQQVSLGDLTFKLWVNQKTKTIDYMDMLLNMNMSSNVSDGVTMLMKMPCNFHFRFYDFNVPFTEIMPEKVKDISEMPVEKEE